MIHVVKNQLKYILLNERPRDLICRVYPTVNDVSVCYLHFSETKKPTPLFKQHMTKAINQYNFHKVRLTGSAFLTNALLLRLNNPYVRLDEMRTWSCSKYLTLLHSTRLNYLAGEKSGIYRNELPYELSFLSLLIYSCTAVSYPSLLMRLFCTFVVAV